MDQSGNVNFEMLEAIADFQIGNGLNGFFVCGTTGEGLLLSEDERNEIVDRLVKHVNGRVAVVAHVGHPSTDVATRLAKASADRGADWIASIPPVFYGQSRESAVRHYQQIAQATDLPFMVYSIGQEIDPTADLELFEIPNVSGMKYTGANFFSVQQLARNLKPGTSLLSGFDEQFVAGQSFGFDGGIGSTYNFAPGYYADIFRSYHGGNIEQAASLQEKINRVTHLMIQYENWSYRKAIMRYIGYDCGACRAPYAPISENEYQQFAEKLDALGVLQRNDG